MTSGPIKFIFKWPVEYKLKYFHARKPMFNFCFPNSKFEVKTFSSLNFHSLRRIDKFPTARLLPHVTCLKLLLLNVCIKSLIVVIYFIAMNSEQYILITFNFRYHKCAFIF